MSVRQFILDGLNRVFRLRGMELRTVPTANTDTGMDAGIARVARLVPEIATVVDVGAAAGLWTRRALQHFPKARHLLIEPLQEREAELAALRVEHPNVEFALAAAGEAPGEVTLNVAGNLDSSGVYGPSAPNPRAVPLTTIDREIEARKLPAPYFFKLDTHGFEVPVLNGAAASLAKTALLMIEVNNFSICPGCLRFHELCAWLEERGFRTCDLLEPMRRERDNVLWQMDLVFARHDHPAFATSTYR